MVLAMHGVCRRARVFSGRDCSVLARTAPAPVTAPPLTASAGAIAWAATADPYSRPTAAPVQRASVRRLALRMSRSCGALRCSLRCRGAALCDRAVNPAGRSCSAGRPTSGCGRRRRRRLRATRRRPSSTWTPPARPPAPWASRVCRQAPPLSCSARSRARRRPSPPLAAPGCMQGPDLSRGAAWRCLTSGTLVMRAAAGLSDTPSVIAMTA